MPLGTEVGLGLGDIVLDGDPAPPKKGHSPTIFVPCLLWPNGCIYQDFTWYGGRPRPRRHCVRWGPAPPNKKGAHPPIFGPCLLWPNGRPSQLLLSSCNTFVRHWRSFYNQAVCWCSRVRWSNEFAHYLRYAFKGKNV